MAREDSGEAKGRGVGGNDELPGVLVTNGSQRKMAPLAKWPWFLHTAHTLPTTAKTTVN